MIEIIASNNDRLPVGKMCAIKTDLWGNPETFLVVRGIFDTENVEFKSIAVEVLDEEKSKSFMGSAGLGLVGAALLGPLGLIAGALAGGNKKIAIFGLSFKFHDNEVKLVVKSSKKSEITALKEKSFAA